MKCTSQMRAVVLCLVVSETLFSQSAGTGAIAGIVTDSTGALVPAATITVTNPVTGDVRTVTSGDHGNYIVSMLLPGSYTVAIRKAGFKRVIFADVSVSVTDTSTLNINLAVGAEDQRVEVQGNAQQLQTENSSLGNITNSKSVESLPLVTRNYTQTIGLSPGVAMEVTNAGELGRGHSSDGEDPIISSGGSWSDNNFQMDGVEINDLQSSGHFSGGVAVPNPDSIQEFKVQTGQYDASYGRDAGANVNLVTKSGTNRYHGTLFEFFRNDAMNANNWFLNHNDQPRPVLRQNQYGMTFGGPIVKNKLLFFTSYQGTRQVNGVDSTCSTTFTLPPLTNDRSAAALGKLFAGQPTFIQQVTGQPLGPTVLPDGSNISSQALALMEMKLPNGQYLIPTPQTINSSLPFASQGSLSVSDPCTFYEEQFMTNADWIQSSKSRWQVRFFFDNSHQDNTLPYTYFGGPTGPGFPVSTTQHFRNFSLSNDYAINSSFLNQIQVGYHRQYVNVTQQEAFKYSDIGVNAPSFDNSLPEIFISGALTLGGNGQDVTLAQNTYVVQDNASWQKGRHSLRLGGGVTRSEINIPVLSAPGGILFFSFPDFLLGEDAATNGTNLSNVYSTVDQPGLLTREYRVWDANTYIQDDFKMTPSLTLNLGIRWERLGAIGENLGRNSNFDFLNSNPNPPADGTLQGYIVPSNYVGPVPPGVTRSDNNLGIQGDGQNTWNPRIGFAWVLPDGGKAVLRGGYGVSHERLAGEPFLQLVDNPPFAQLRQLVGSANAAASFANPFPPGTPEFPTFSTAAYSPTTQLSTVTFAQNFRPPKVQLYSLNVQLEVAKNVVLELGYVGSRGTDLIRVRQVNQALEASPDYPIRGQTEDLLSNLVQRAPYEGWGSASAFQIESAGSSWYNALEATLTKRFSSGLQFLAAYTWSKSLTTDYAESTGANGGVDVGNQNDPAARYGPDPFIRPQRFVFSFVYELSSFGNSEAFVRNIFGGWRLAGITTIQAGHLLAVTNTNANNLFGISGQEEDFGELSPNCNLSQVNTAGPVQSKLNDYINQSCFINPPIISADGGTAFGNTKPGIVHGPAQNNTDLALIKNIPLPQPHEKSTVEFRVEAFNVFNHPQFADPVTAFDSASFGQVLNTSVAPRILQLALKLIF